MKPSLTVLFLTALVALLSLRPGARAEPLSWAYLATPTPVDVPVNPATGALIGFTSQETGAFYGASSTITAALVSAFSSASPSQPDRFANQPYALSFTLSDPLTRNSATLSFSGQLTGSLTQNSVSLTSTFQDPSQSLTLDGHLLTVTITSFTAPALPGPFSQGRIQAVVSVDNPNAPPPLPPPPPPPPPTPSPVPTHSPNPNPGPSPPPPPPVSGTPEPSTFALAALGTSLLGGAVARWGRRGAILKTKSEAAS